MDMVLMGGVEAFGGSEDLPRVDVEGEAEEFLDDMVGPDRVRLEDTEDRFEVRVGLAVVAGPALVVEAVGFVGPTRGLFDQGPAVADTVCGEKGVDVPPGVYDAAS